MLLSYSAFHKFVGIVFGMEYSFSTSQVNFLFCINDVLCLTFVVSATVSALNSMEALCSSLRRLNRASL